MPGLQAHYWFAPGGEDVGLRASLRFDRSVPGARDTLLALRDRLAGYDTGGWDAYTLVTSLTEGAVTAVKGGTALVMPLREFVDSAVAALDREGDPVSAVELAFSLPRQAADLPGDMFELIVAFDLGDGAPRPDRQEPPQFRLVAQPRDFDENVAGFAEAFEAAWRGIDGGEGRLRLAAASGAGPPSLWCVRAGGTCGISIASGANEKPLFLAVPPLSTILLAGTVPDADGKGGEERFEAVELDRYWSVFASGLERLAAAAEGGTLAAGAAYRIRRLTLSVAGLLADRLRPVAPGRAGETALEQARAYLRALSEERLSGRPILCSGRVSVTRGDESQVEPAPRLHGRVAGCEMEDGGGGAGALVSLAAGEQRLLVALPDSGARLPAPLRIEGGWIEPHEGPSLFLLRPEDRDDALGVELDVPGLPPLLRLPSPPALARTAATAAAGADNVGDALRWQVDVHVSLAQALQDRLEIVIALDPSAEPERPAPSPGGALFEALARIVRSAPESPSPEKDPDPAALERYLDLASTAARGLAEWRAPDSNAVPLMPAGWRYAVDFADLPALVVTREPGPSGRLPPWPSLDGFVTPAAEEGEQARYEPDEADGLPEGIRLSVPGLRLLAHRAVRVHARIRRNGGLAGGIDPAFVYHGGVVSSGVLIPWLEWEAPQPENAEPSLAAALGRILDACAEGAADAYGIVVGAELVRRIAGDPDVPVETSFPLVLTPHLRIGPGPAHSGLADLKSGLAAAVAAARAEIGAEDEDFGLVLAVTLFDDERHGPLARLRARIPVPNDDLGWWTRRSASA